MVNVGGEAMRDINNVRFELVTRIDSEQEAQGVMDRGHE